MKRNIFLIAGVAVVVVVLVYILFNHRIVFAPTRNTESLTPHVRINNLIIPVDIARTPAEMKQGLSGRPSLDVDKGMLFLFLHPAIHRFWMPDMRFPIDIIWIADTTIVGIAHNVSNDFDPARPRFYEPPLPVTRVLEVNGGFAARHNIAVGDAVTLSLSSSNLNN